MKIKGTKNKIIVEGNLIFDNAVEVKESLLKILPKLNPQKTVDLDFSGIEEIDSSGLQLLISLLKTLQSKEIQHRVNHISDELMDILQLSGLSKYFRFET